MPGRIRLLAEYLEPLAVFRRQKIRDTVVFFGSARMRDEGPLAQYYQDARTLARMVTEWAAQFTDNGTTASWFVPAAGRALWRRPIAARPMPAARPSA